MPSNPMEMMKRLFSRLGRREPFVIGKEFAAAREAERKPQASAAPSQDSRCCRSRGIPAAGDVGRATSAFQSSGRGEHVHEKLPFILVGPSAPPMRSPRSDAISSENHPDPVMRRSAVSKSIGALNSPE